MKSYWLNMGDGPDQIELRDVPVPTPGPTQALVKIHAAGLNRGEFIKGHGLHGSQGAKAIGMEAAGEIVEMGDASQILNDPQDAYTKTLLSAVPKLNQALV